MKNKKIIIIAMCVAVLLMIVGYAAFATKLSINGTSTITSKWNIYFESITLTETIKEGSEASDPVISGTRISFEVNLRKPGDGVTYKAVLKNAGTVDALINNITAEASGTAIKYTIAGIAKGDSLSAGASKTITIKVMYDESLTAVPNETSNQIDINIECVQDSGQHITPENPSVTYTHNTLAAKILADNTAYADNVASPYVSSSTGINFGAISSDTNGKGLYYTSTNTEDNKTTYYFRGAVENNNVKFGRTSGCGYKGNAILHIIDLSTPTATVLPTESQCKSTPVCDAGTVAKDNYGLDYRYLTGLDAATCAYLGGTSLTEYATYGVEAVDIYWKIIRINEDGSIRLITENPIGSIAFNVNSNDNAYEGYMYGTSGSNNYNDTHANINDSTIKGAIDDWYEDNLKTNYSSYLADPGFCNDRSVASSSYLWNLNDTALGYGKNITSYGGYNRVTNTKQSQFACPNVSKDLFTLKTSTKGNKALSYPIGLITADEVVYAGGNYFTGDQNVGFYLNNGLYYWTMTPYHFNGTDAREWRVASSGQLSSNLAIVGNINGVRPVINLKSTVEVVEGGNGTAGNPYVIK